MVLAVAQLRNIYPLSEADCTNVGSLSSSQNAPYMFSI